MYVCIMYLRRLIVVMLLMLQVSLTVIVVNKLFTLSINYSQVVNNTVRDTSMLDDIKPALGNSWAHVPSTRLMLYYGNGRERIGSIVKSSRQVSFIIIELHYMVCIHELCDPFYSSFDNS